MPSLHTPMQWLRWFGRNTKRLIVLLLGVAVLVAGVLMLVMPGPGILVILLGLVILATEFAWAERALDLATAKAAGAATRVQSSTTGRWSLAASGTAMLVGGILVAILLPSFLVVGITVALAGAIGLVTLHPKVERWIESKAQEPTPEPATAGG